MKENLPEDQCIFQSCIWCNEHFCIIRDKVELKVGVGDMNLEVDHVSQNEINCTEIPTHTVLLAFQPKRVCIAAASISVIKKANS